MSDMKDLGFRLFGRNIQLSPKDRDIVLWVDQDNDKDYNDDYGCDYECISSNDSSKQGANREEFEKATAEGPNTTKQEEKPAKSKKGSHSTITDDVKTTSNDKECTSQDSINGSSNDQTSSTTPQDQKPLQKPDKIIPCPRCNSMTTKFCYFNNYNVHQPRHFCKDCQRYWTAGGTMRSVPVGSGRRKKKSSLTSAIHHPEISFGFVQNKGGNEITFQSLPPQMPCIFNPVGWQSGFPVSFYSADHSSTISTTTNSDTSRKHSRNEKISENARVVRTKITNVHDPIEAANSSIWTTLQNKNKQDLITRPIAKAGFFGHHQRNNDPSVAVSSMVMQFNPAAFSRSLLFQEIR